MVLVRHCEGREELVREVEAGGGWQLGSIDACAGLGTVREWVVGS